MIICGQPGSLLSLSLVGQAPAITILLTRSYALFWYQNRRELGRETHANGNLHTLPSGATVERGVNSRWV